ncbi:MAG: hydroxyacylglutathione hydrolase [Chlamydiales bacterium]|nr:hydroxyacylglutathione hydrolase [Chlamydiales bacterium]
MSLVWNGKLSHIDVTIHALPALADNYIFMLVWENKGICIDPGEAKPVIEFVKQYDLELTAIFITHHHADHMNGVAELVEKFDTNVLGPIHESLGCVQQMVNPDDELITGPFIIKVLAVSGHTKEHVAYYFTEKHLLFSGDLVFGGGCGRVVDGTVEELFSSIKAVAHLPKDTKIFFAHEYTLNNLSFAKTIDPENKMLDQRYKEEERRFSLHEPTVPTTLEVEFHTNPFFRVKEHSIRKVLQMESAPDLEVFAKIRLLKDQYGKKITP